MSLSIHGVRTYVQRCIAISNNLIKLWKNVYIISIVLDMSTINIYLTKLKLILCIALKNEKRSKLYVYGYLHIH